MRSNHPLYYVWKSMRSRCRNKNRKEYKYYGGRGITVCPEWQHNFSQFVDDMGPRPKGYLLERKDNNKGYAKDNCKWATRREQQRNRNCTVFVTLEGKQFKVIELAELAGVKFDTILSRVKRGLSYDKVIQKEHFRGQPTREERQKRGRAAGETRRSKPTCKRGHLLDEQNKRMEKNGQRACRRCHALRQLHYGRKRRGVPTEFPS